MWETLGQAIWEGAIQRLAREAAPVFGAALNSNLTGLVGRLYPQLRASSQAGLVRFATEAIRAARAYQQGPAAFIPALGQLPNLFQPVEYEMTPGWLNNQGYVRGFNYSFTIYTTNTNLATGAQTVRANEVNYFSPNIMTREQALAAGHFSALEWIHFRQGTDDNNQQTFDSVEFNAVMRTYGQP